MGWSTATQAKGDGVNLNDPISARTELARALEGGHPENIAAAAMNNVWPLYCAHYELLVKAIACLPTAVLGRYPVLRVVHPITPVLAHANRPFKPLVYQGDARTMSPEALDMLTLCQMLAFRVSGDVSAAVIYSQRLEERISTVRAESHYRTDGPLWFYHAQIGTTRLAAGDSSGALRELAVAQQLASLSIQPDAERFTLAHTALAHATRGSLAEAQVMLASSRSGPNPTAGHAAAIRSAETTTAALIASERLSSDLDECIAHLEPLHSYELSWPFSVLARANALLARQRPHEALETIHVASSTHPTQHGADATDIIAAASIEALIAAGDEHQARQLPECKSPHGVRAALARAALTLQEGRLTAAAKELHQISCAPEAGPGVRGRHQVLSAWLEFARTGTLGARTATAIFHLALTRDYRRTLALAPIQLIAEVQKHLNARESEEFERAAHDLEFQSVSTPPSLTKGERRVLSALSRHETVADIAAAFHVSPNTIKSQLKSLYRKLECSTRDEAIDIGSRFRFASPDHDGAAAK